MNIVEKNLTSAFEFHLMGLSEDPDLQPILSGLFLSMYLVTVLGNLLIILSVSSESHPHTPMYLFLSNLSFIDICFISTTVPKMILDIQTPSRIISFVGCLSQMSLFSFFVCMESLLLSVMAYDRFVTICHPLQYPVIMNCRVCGVLVFLSFLLSIFDSQLHNLIILQCTYYKTVEISNFFCDPSQLLHLICSDTFTNTKVIHFIGAMFGFFPISGILFSYYKIVSSVLLIPSTDGKFKAFSTCGSHLSVVFLFCAASLTVYLGSAMSSSSKKDVVSSVMYTVVTPMLNPFIYTLSNRDIKKVLSRFHSRTF